MSAAPRKAKALPQEPALTKVGEYFVHPYKAFVPEMGKTMFRAHVEKIRRNKGQSHPITLDKDGLLLDGRADVRACEELGFELLTPVRKMGDPAQFVMDSLIGTRYSKAQCAVVAARLLKAIQDESAAAKRAGEKKSKKFTGRAADFVGRLAGDVSAPLVYQARKLLDTHESIIGAIDSGHIEHFSHAVELSKYDEPKLRRALKRIVDDKKDPAVVLDRATKIDDEWFTPEYILEAVRFAFGGTIDCDPCSPSKKTPSGRRRLG